MSARRLLLPALLLCAGCVTEADPEHIPGTPLRTASGDAPAAASAPAASAAPELVGGVPTHPRLLPKPEPLRYAPEPVAPFLLGNGAKVFFVPDPSVPLVHLTAHLRTGLLDEPADLPGLSGLTGQAMRTGGAGEWTPEALDELLEDLGARVSSEIGDDMGSVSMTCRVQDLPKVLVVLRSVLETPRFDEARVSLLLGQFREQLRRLKDQPGGLVDRASGPLLFGKDSPWARVATEESAAGITLERIRAFHQEKVLPSLWSLSASGDITEENLKPLLERALGDLPRAAGPGPEAPACPGVQERRIVLIPKTLSQATLFLGHAGPPNFLDGQPHPDRFPLQVFNFLLGGGGFSTALVKEVRVSRGLAYSVYSSLSMDCGRGSVGMHCQTRTEAAAESLSVMRQVLEGLLAKDIPPEEVERAKTAIVNAFVFKGATPARRAASAATYDYFGFPPDYLSRYVSRIQAVTAEDVNRAARTYYHPDRMSVVVCGDRQVLEAPLASLGTVEIQEP